jgi:hypothetical protein
MHCTITLLAHIWLFYLLDRVYVELELEEPMVQALVEAITNLALDQGKPRYIKLILLVFYFESCFMFYYNCVLSLYELYDIVVAFRLTFLFILINPISWWLTISNAMLR